MANQSIVCHKIANSKTVRSFIEKKLVEWFQGHGIDKQSAQYQVILDREGNGHVVSCRIEVEAEVPNQDGTTATHLERWTGDWAASGLHQAFLKTLNHMMHPQFSPTTPHA